MHWRASSGRRGSVPSVGSFATSFSCVRPCSFPPVEFAYQYPSRDTVSLCAYAKCTQGSTEIGHPFGP